MPQAERHIGIDATSWSNDRGFGRFTREFVTALAARGNGYRYTLVFDQPPTIDVPDTVDTLIASTASSLNENAVGDASRSPFYLWQLGRLVGKAGFDMFFFPAVYSYFPLLSRIPCVICYHDTTAERIPHLLFPTKRNHLLWRVKTQLAKWQTTRAMTVSQCSANDMENILKIPRRKIDVVTEAADALFRPISDRSVLDAARTRQNIPLDAEVLVYVGGMNAHKNILGLLRAMPRVIAERPDVHLAIVGDTSGKGFWDNVPELMKFVADTAPLEKHVHFTGYLSDEGLVDLFGSAAALVFPSLWEGFGLPAVEAMSCGVPVLSSDRGSLPEVVGDAGIFFNPESVDEIAATILRFLGDPSLRENLRQAALPRSRLFTWDKAAKLGEISFEKCCADASKR